MNESAATRLPHLW